MSPMTARSGSAKNAAHRNKRNSFETESSYSKGSSAPAQNQEQTLRNRFRETSYSVASGLGNVLSDAAHGIVNEVTGYDDQAYDTSADQYDVDPQSGSETSGGVNIPTFAEYQLEQQQKHLQFFQEQQRAVEAIVKRRQKEDEKKVEEIKQMLKTEIQRFEKLQHQMNENIEKAKKLLLLDDRDIRKGLYHVTMAEVVLMALRNAIMDISNSNNWLEALISRKKKRGSLFASRTKQQGTQYSLSQELSIARSTG